MNDSFTMQPVKLEGTNYQVCSLRDLTAYGFYRGKPGAFEHVFDVLPERITEVMEYLTGLHGKNVDTRYYPGRISQRFSWLTYPLAMAVCVFWAKVWMPEKMGVQIV